MKLYVYDHCPFCVKARMIFGLKNRPVELIMLLNDDEETPIKMIGAKMVPILQKADGRFMPESMDIVHYIDTLQGAPALAGDTNPAIADWMKQTSTYLNKLLIPRFVQAPFAEFQTPSARAYFTQKKTASIGDFDRALQQSPELIAQLQQDLLALAPCISSPHACNGTLSTDDIHLFAMLRGISIIKGVDYPKPVDDYRRAMALMSNVNLLDDIAL